MEGAHGQLGARLPDRLRGDDTHRLADLDQLAGRQVAAVAGTADALARLAHEDGTNLDVDAGRDDLPRGVVGDGLARRHDHLAVHRDVLGRHAAGDLLEDRIVLGPLRCDVPDPDSVAGAAVLLADDHVLGDVDQAPGEIPGVGGAERGVGETLARAVGRDEVLEHGQAFGEVGLDRQVDDPPRRVGHQAAHARELADLLDVAAGARAHHHPDRAELVEGDLGLGAHVLVGALPQLDHLAVALVLGHDAAPIHLLDVRHFLLRRTDDLPLRVRVRDVHRGDGDPGLGRVAEAEPLDVVDHARRRVAAVQPVQLGDQHAQQLAVVVRVLERKGIHGRLHRRLADGQRLVEDDAAGRGDDQPVADLDPHPLLELDHLGLERQDGLVLRAERPQPARLVVGRHLATRGGQPVAAQHDVLRRRDHRVAVRR